MSATKTDKVYIGMNPKNWHALMYAALISSANYYGPNTDEVRYAIGVVQDAIAQSSEQE